MHISQCLMACLQMIAHAFGAKPSKALISTAIKSGDLKLEKIIFILLFYVHRIVELIDSLCVQNIE